MMKRFFVTLLLLGSMFGQTYQSTKGTQTVGTLRPLFTPTTPFNTTAFGLLNPSLDCITQLMDSNITFNGKPIATALSEGNLTVSGGDNDPMSSRRMMHAAWHANGTNYIMKFKVNGNCLLNDTNGGENPSISAVGSFGFSRVNDWVYYNVPDNHTIHRWTITDGPPMTATESISSIFPFDLLNCPGPIPSSVGSNSILSIGLNDHDFNLVLAPLGQGTGTVVVHYRPSVGCKTIDFATGNIFGWCLSNCSSEPPETTETACVDIQPGPGIHDSQMTWDGEVSSVSGGCQNLGTTTQNVAFIDWDTDIVLGVNDTTSTFGQNVHWVGHSTLGISRAFQVYNPNPNERQLSPLTISNLENYTNLNPLPNFGQFTINNHGSQPHPLLDDSYPEIIANMVEDGLYLTPAYLEDEIYGEPMDGSLPYRFVNTYNTNTSPNFGCQNAIQFISPDGNWSQFISDHLNHLGTDGNGKPFCYIFGVHLQ